MGNNTLCHRKVRFGHEFKDAKTTALWPNPRPTQPSPTQVRPAPPNSLKSSCFLQKSHHRLPWIQDSEPDETWVQQPLYKHCGNEISPSFVQILQAENGQTQRAQRAKIAQQKERERERAEKASTETRKQRATKQLYGPKPMKSMDKINRNLFFNEITVKFCLSMHRVSF